ncbi:MAG: glucosaminidase domain-containing protein, partial [Streptococcus sp.]
MEKNMTSTDERTVAFIAEIGETSRYLAARNDLYASVMIAQAILESDSGQSTLSQKPSYNFFGIKGDYNGQSVTLPTWEDDGKGNPYYIDAAFRSWPVENSLQDYVDFLEEATVWEQRSKTSYKDATAALTGVYATDTTYGDKLNSIIEQYQLTIYDTY